MGGDYCPTITIMVDVQENGIMRLSETGKFLGRLTEDEEVNFRALSEFALPEFQDEIKHLINKYSLENGSDTPDFILAQFLVDCLKVFNYAAKRRENWYGRKLFIEEKSRTHLG